MANVIGNLTPLNKCMTPVSESTNTCLSFPGSANKPVKTASTRMDSDDHMVARAGIAILRRCSSCWPCQAFIYATNRMAD